MNRAEGFQEIAGELSARMRWYEEMGIKVWRAPKACSGTSSKAPVSPPSTPASPPEQSNMPGALLTLEMIREALGECQRCKLAPTRTRIVFGAGSPKADLLFIGEGPGRDEDLQGEPFVGRAGQLLTRMIEAMGLSRGSVYIANIIKCRPPNNRNPQADEIASCRPFLAQQIAAIKPKVICALGTFSAQTLLKTDRRISEMRGHFYDLNGVKVLPTFHPAYLLRNPSQKKAVWQDLQKIMAELDLPRRKSSGGKSS